MNVDSLAMDDGSHALKAGAREELGAALCASGHADLCDTLFPASLQSRLAFLERCAIEARSVLRGDLAGAGRLWLLLREPVAATPAIPGFVIDLVAGGNRRDAPIAIDADYLLTLVAGTVRAANQPGERDALLEALARLIDPLLWIECAARGARRAAAGDVAILSTLAAAAHAPYWRAAIDRIDLPALEPPPQADTITSAQRLTEPAPFDPPLWNEPPIPASALDPWGKLYDCLPFMRLEMSQVDRFGPRWVIDSIEPVDACPGELITIRGHGFGTSGRVIFTAPGAGDPVLQNLPPLDLFELGIEPQRWSSSEIQVVVPPQATTGEVRLLSFTRHDGRCKTIYVYRLGDPFVFQGGLANVAKVWVNGVEQDPQQTAALVVRPGKVATVTWLASAGPHAQVHLELRGPNGTVLFAHAGLPGGYASLQVPIPQAQEPTLMVLTVAATSGCAATLPRRVPILATVPPVLTITYVEVTQGIQADLYDVQAGRGMPTVAYKDTAVRVHMRCDRGNWFFNQLDKITGELRLDDAVILRPINQRPAIPDTGYAAVRGWSEPIDTNSTLNFRIPAAYLTPGRHSLSVRLVCNDPSGRMSATQRIEWDWVSKTPLAVRCLWLAIDGQWQKPAMLDYAARVLDLLPTPLTEIGISSTVWFSHSYDLSTDDGWQNLLDDVEDQWGDYHDASGARWLAIVPPSERRPSSVPPFNLAWGGIAGTPGKVAVAMGDRPEAGAHELGHTLGLNHVALGSPGGKFPDGPYDVVDNSGYVSRVPFDVRAGMAVTPGGDLMSYLAPARPGFTTWLRLFNMQF